jgi:hypothetical protein
MIRRYVIPALLFAFAILLTIPALAQSDGQAIGACTVIDKPGPYVLARNITTSLADLKRNGLPNSMPACILIVADFVSLDLQGHTITGPGARQTWDNAGIYSTADASGKSPMGIEIRNGSVTGFEFGVYVEGTGHTVAKVRIVGDGVGMCIRGATGIKVKEVTAVSSQQFGILLFGNTGVSIEDSQISSNGGTGIHQQGPDPRPDPEQPFGGRIVGNTVSNNGGYGIYAQCPTLILQNMAYNNGSGEQDNIVVHGTTCTRANNSPEP